MNQSRLQDVWLQLYTAYELFRILKQDTLFYNPHEFSPYMWVRGFYFTSRFKSETLFLPNHNVTLDLYESADDNEFGISTYVLK